MARPIKFVWAGDTANLQWQILPLCDVAGRAHKGELHPLEKLSYGPEHPDRKKRLQNDLFDFYRSRIPVHPHNRFLDG